MSKGLMQLFGFCKKIYNKNLFFIKSIILILFIYLVYKNINFNQIKSIQIGWLMLAFCAVLISNACGNIFWWLMIHYVGLKISFRDTIKSYWLGLFFNNLLPTNVGGDVVRGFNFKFTKKNPLLVILSVVYDRIFGVAILIAIGIFTGLAIFYDLKLTIIFSAMSLTGLLLILILSKKFIIRIIKKIIRIFTFLLPNPRALKIILILLTHIQTTLTRKKLPSLLAYNFFMLLSQLLKIVMNYFIVLGLVSTQVHRLPPEYVFFIVPVFGLLSLFTLTPGGLGIREYLCSLLFKSLPNVYHPNADVDYTPEIVVISFVSHLLVILASMPGLFLYLKKK